MARVLIEICTRSRARWADGGDPLDDRVAVDAAGNVFGTTLNGGSFGICTLGCGVVFEVTP